MKILHSGQRIFFIVFVEALRLSENKYILGVSFFVEGDPIRHLLLHCIAKAKTTRAKVDFLLRNIKTSFVPPPAHAAHQPAPSTG